METRQRIPVPLSSPPIEPSRTAVGRTLVAALLLAAAPAVARLPTDGARLPDGPPSKDGRDATPRPAARPRAASRDASREPDLPRLRQVIRGALYRSGSPTEGGLQRVCRAGWKRVYSIYGPRTTSNGLRNQAMIETGRDERRCDGPDGEPRVLEWRSGTASRNHSIPLILRDVRDSIREPSQGPVLIHCWNGLHYAGMISAMALRQFCGFSADEAEAYWRANANFSTRYPRIIQHIRAFRPDAGLALTPAERRHVCPDPGHLLAAREALPP